MSARRRPYRILVADDDPLILNLVRTVLQAEGHAVTTCESGSEALAIFRGADPSILISDLEMPGASGLEVIRELRKGGLRIPVILISGNMDAQTIDASRRFERVKCVPKPFSPAELAALVTEMVESDNPRDGLTST